MANKIVQQLQETIEWVAAEYKYLKELHELLQQEQQLFRKQLGTVQAKKKSGFFHKDARELHKKRNLKQALHVARYIGRAEQRANQKLDKSLAEVLLIMESLPDTELQKTIKQIQVPRNFLVNDSSRYLGSLRKGLKRIALLINMEEKYGTQSLESQILQELSGLETRVEELTTWVGSLEVGLEHLKGLEEEKGLSRRGFLKLASSAAAAAVIASLPLKALAQGSSKENIAQEVYDVMTSNKDLKQFIEAQNYGFYSKLSREGAAGGQKLIYQAQPYIAHGRDDKPVLGFKAQLILIGLDPTGNTYTYWDTNMAPETTIRGIRIENCVVTNLMKVRGIYVEDNKMPKRTKKEKNAEGLHVLTKAIGYE